MTALTNKWHSSSSTFSSCHLTHTHTLTSDVYSQNLLLHFMYPLNTQGHMPCSPNGTQVFVCVYCVSVCVAGVVRWQLLCTVVCVASWGGGSPDPQTVSDDPDPRSRNSRSDCWTEADKQQNDWGSDSRWTAAVGGADDSLSVCNLSDDRDHCSLTPPPLLRLYEHSHSDAVCLCGCILEEKLRYSKTLAKGFHLLL